MPSFGGFYATKGLLELAKKSTNVTSMERFDRSIIDEANTGNITSEVAMKSLEGISGTLILAMRKRCPYLNPNWEQSEPLRHGGNSEAAHRISAADFVDLMEHCTMLGLCSATENIVGFLIDVGRISRKDAIDGLLLPILKIVPLPYMAIGSGRYQHSFQNIILSHMDRQIAHQPAILQKWSQE